MYENKFLLQRIHLPWVTIEIGKTSKAFYKTTMLSEPQERFMLSERDFLCWLLKTKSLKKESSYRLGTSVLGSRRPKAFQ